MKTHQVGQVEKKDLTKEGVRVISSRQEVLLVCSGCGKPGKGKSRLDLPNAELITEWDQRRHNEVLYSQFYSNGSSFALLIEQTIALQPLGGAAL